MKTLEQINAELNEGIPKAQVSSRAGGGGRQLSYLQGHYVIDRLNKIFGPLNWSSTIIKMDMVHGGTIVRKDSFGKEKTTHAVHYICQVRLTVNGTDGVSTSHVCVGYGDGEDPVSPGKAHELAVKEAETDALKRCAKNLGMSMGLALYDKEQSNVVNEEARKEIAQDLEGSMSLNGLKGNWERLFPIIEKLSKADQDYLVTIKDQMKGRLK